MKASCSLCLKCEAVLECEEDAARLCAACDELVHGANRLSNRHTRWPLCSLCGHFKATRGDHLADEQDSVVKYACEACAAQLPRGSRPEAMLLAPLPPPQLKATSPQPGGRRMVSQHATGQQRPHRHSSNTLAASHGHIMSEPRSRAPAPGSHARQRRVPGGTGTTASQNHRGQRCHGHAGLEVPGSSHLMELSTDAPASDPRAGVQEPGHSSRFMTLKAAQPYPESAIPSYGMCSAAPQAGTSSQAAAAGRAWDGVSSNDVMCAADADSFMLSSGKQSALRRPQADDGWIPNNMLETDMPSNCYQQLQQLNGQCDRQWTSSDMLPGSSGNVTAAQAQASIAEPAGLAALGQDDPELLDHLFSTWTQETSNTPGLGGMEDLWPMELAHAAGGNLMCVDLQAAGPAGLLRPDSLPQSQRQTSQGDDLHMLHLTDERNASCCLTSDAGQPAWGNASSASMAAGTALGLSGDLPVGSGMAASQYPGTLAAATATAGGAVVHKQQQGSLQLNSSSPAQHQPQPSIFSMPCSHQQPAKHQTAPNSEAQATSVFAAQLSMQQQQQRPLSRQLTDAPAMPTPGSADVMHVPSSTGAAAYPVKPDAPMPQATKQLNSAFAQAAAQVTLQPGLIGSSVGAGDVQSGSHSQGLSSAHGQTCAAPTLSPANAMQPASWGDMALQLAGGSMPATHASMLCSLQQLLQPLTQPAAAASTQVAPSEQVVGQQAHREATLQLQLPQMRSSAMHNGPTSSMQHDGGLAAAVAAAASYARPPAGMLLPPVPLPLPPGMTLDQLDPQQQQHVAIQHMLLLQQRHALLLALASGRGSLPDGLLPGLLPGAAMHFAAIAAAAAQPPGLSGSMRATDMGPPSSRPQQQQTEANRADATLDAPACRQMLGLLQTSMQQPQSSGLHSHPSAEQQQQQQMQFNPAALAQMQGTLPMGLTAASMGTGALPDLLSNPNASGLPMANPLPMGMLGGGAMAGMGQLPVLPGLLGAGYPRPPGTDLPPHLLHMMHPQLAMLAMLNQQQLAKAGGGLMPWDAPVQQQAMSQEARSTQSIKHQPCATQPTSSNSQKQQHRSSGDFRTAEKASVQSSKHAADVHPRTSQQVATAPHAVHQASIGIGGPGSGQHTMSGSFSGGGQQQTNSIQHAQLHQQQQQQQQQRHSAAGLMLPPMGMGLPPLPPGLALNPYLMFGAAAATGMPPERLQQFMTPWMLSAAAAAAAGGSNALPPGLLPPGLPLAPFMPPASQMGAAAHTAPTVCSVRPSGSGEAQGFAAGSMQLRMAGTQPALSQMSLPPGMAQPRGGSEARPRGASSTGAALSMGPMGVGMMSGTGLPPDSVWSHDQRYSERGQALTRYRQKRKLRHFEKTIRYASRQVRAHKRPRIKGRFIKAPAGGTAEANAACFGYTAPGAGGLGRTPSTLAIANMVVEGQAEVEEGEGEGDDMLVDDDLPMHHEPDCSEQHSGRAAGAMSSTDADADAELSEEERRSRPMVHSPALPGLHGRGSALLLPAAAAPVTATSTLHCSSVNDDRMGAQQGPVPSVGAPAPAELQGEQPPRQPTVSNSMTSRASMGSVHQGGGKGTSRPSHPAGAMALGMAQGAASALMRGTPSAGAGEAVDEQGQGAGQEGSVWGPGLAAVAFLGGGSGLRIDSVGQVAPAATLGLLAGGQQRTATKQAGNGGMRMKLLDESSSSSSQNKHAAYPQTPPKGGKAGAAGQGAAQTAAGLAAGGNGARKHGSAGSSGGRSSGQRGAGAGRKPSPAVRGSTGTLPAMPAPPAPANAEIQGEQPLHVAAPAESESAENTPPALDPQTGEQQVVGPCRAAATIPSIASNGVGQPAGVAIHPVHAQPQHSSDQVGGLATLGQPPADGYHAIQHSRSTRGRGRGSSTGAQPNAAPHGAAGEVGAMLQCASLGTAVGSHHLTGSCGNDVPGAHTAATGHGCVCADDEMDPDGNFCDSVAPEVSGASNTLPSMEASTLCPDGMETAGARDAPSTLITFMQGSKRSKGCANHTMPPPEGGEPDHPSAAPPQS